MQHAGLSPVRPARAKHRHELRTLTYVTLDEAGFGQANGGIVRNLNHEGIAVQAVGEVRPRQRLRVRFELRDPRLRVETHGEVTWATVSGQCGIRFLDLSPKTRRQINEWVFADLLAGCALHAGEAGSMFAASADSSADSMDDGLIVSAGARKVIELPPKSNAAPVVLRETVQDTRVPLDWLSQPLSGRRLIWTINTLAVFAALLLFALIFLTVAGEAPQWPLTTAGAAAICVVGLYWGFFQLFGGSSPGVRLARMVGADADEERANDARFR